MAEPVKVNAYYIVSSFAAGKECWWVLSDGDIAIITKPENVFEIDRENHKYSILQDKDSSYTTLSGAELSLLFIRNNEVTIVRKGEKNGSNKQNVTKI